MVLQAHGPRQARPLREACANCVGFGVLLILGVAAWAGVFLVCSRF